MIETIFKFMCLFLLVCFVIWRVYMSFHKSNDPSSLLYRWILTFVLIGIAIPTIMSFGGMAGGHVSAFAMPILTAAFCVLIGLVWAPIWGEWIASPLTSMYDGGLGEGDDVPLYSVAEARRKRGRYKEAVVEIERQLERFPGDLTGTLLLIDVHAKDLSEMRPAQYAAESFLEQGPHHPKNTFLVLAHLGDAYLSHSDREGARRCFERIEQLCKGTEQEMIAAQRLAHLASDEDLAARKEPKRIALKQYDRHLGLRKGADHIGIQKSEDPDQLAAEYVEQLQSHPLDFEAREKLALLYANHYGRLDMAIEQLEMLVKLDNQPARQIARWLHKMADLHIRIDGNIPAARACLKRVCNQFPDTALAAQANKRTHLLELEKKGGPLQNI